MKKITALTLSLLSLGTVCMLTTPLLYAESTTTATSSIQSATVPAEIVPETALRENTGEITKERQTRAVNLCANISNRFDAEAMRLEIITKRLQSRIQKMEEAQYDVVQAKIKLAEAQKNSTEIKANLGDIDTQVFQAIGSEKPREAWVNVRVIFTHTHELLMKTKQILQETIVLLKESEQKGTTNTPVASSTTTTEPNSSIE